MTISPIALTAQKTIEAAWLHGPSHHLASQAAFALESAKLLQSPEIAAELVAYRALELGTPEGRISAKCENATHPVWLRDLDDMRGCPWCLITESKARPLFLAEYEGAVPELFTTAEAARDCCDDLAQVDAHGRYWDWTVDEHGVHVQFWTHPDDDRPTGETSGIVTRLVVQGDDQVSELQQLRARVAELEAALADRVPVDEEPIQYSLTESEVPARPYRAASVVNLPLLLAGQFEDPHDSPLHHDYRVSHDLPEVTA